MVRCWRIQISLLGQSGRTDGHAEDVGRHSRWPVERTEVPSLGQPGQPTSYMARASHNVGEEPDGHPAKRESCASPSRACAREMRGNSKLSDLKEKARLATLEANRGQVKTAQQANSQSTGYDLGSTYYVRTAIQAEGSRHHVTDKVVGSTRSRVAVSERPDRPSGGACSRGWPQRVAAGRFRCQPLCRVRRIPPISLDLRRRRRTCPNTGTGSTTATTAPTPTALSVDLRFTAISASPTRWRTRHKIKTTTSPFPTRRTWTEGEPDLQVVVSRDTRQCFFENKLRIVLDDNPDVRDACAEKLGAGSSLRDELAKRLGGGDDGQGDPNANAYTRCIDDAYLHGLHPKSTVGLREELKRKLEDKSECRT